MNSATSKKAMSPVDEPPVEPGADVASRVVSISLEEPEKEEKMAVLQEKPISESLIFIRSRNPQGCITDTRMLKNNMLFGVSLLELANAGDFAANVWNTIPVPIYAAVLMGVGGTFALVISCFAFRDALMSWENVKLLREERQFLKHQRATRGMDQKLINSLQCRLDVNFRELGCELVSRYSMDIIMGFASLLVGVGTLMAIGGRNPRVYRASNLLSGFIGNSPAAFWGVLNASWYIFVWKRAQRHDVTAQRDLGESNTVRLMLHRRITLVKWHAAMNSIAGFFAGVASLITSTYWYGYIALAPCILAALASNHLFRHKILYTRPTIQEMPFVETDTTIRQLSGIASIRDLLSVKSTAPLQPQPSLSPQNIHSIITYIVELGLFEIYCRQILDDQALAMILFGDVNQDITIDSLVLQKTEGASAQHLVKLAEKLLNTLDDVVSPHREAFLVDTLGCLLCNSNKELEESRLAKPEDRNAESC